MTEHSTAPTTDLPAMTYDVEGCSILHGERTDMDAAHPRSCLCGYPGNYMECPNRPGALSDAEWAEGFAGVHASDSLERAVAIINVALPENFAYALSIDGNGRLRIAERDDNIETAFEPLAWTSENTRFLFGAGAAVADEAAPRTGIQEASRYGAALALAIATGDVEAVRATSTKMQDSSLPEDALVALLRVAETWDAEVSKKLDVAANE